jgi:hypothetical protein
MAIEPAARLKSFPRGLLKFGSPVRFVLPVMEPSPMNE